MRRLNNMKNKKILIISIIIVVILVILSFVANYVDKGRVSTGHEPKFTIKIVSENGNKVTYWGLGYKVVRYPSVSPNEPYKNNRGVKMGSWFMKYELSEFESIKIELLMDGKTIEVDEKQDVEFIVSLLRDSKYIHELCDGINTHKIMIENEIYYLKESCKEVQKGRKQAKLSDEDLNSLLKIVDNYNDIDEPVNEEEQYQFIGTIIEAHDNYIIVKPDDETKERKSSDKIRMSITRPTSGVNDFYVKGNKVKITYNGNINESYPAQIKATKIELAS